MAWFVVLVSAILTTCVSSVVLESYEPAYIQDANPSFMCLPKNVSDVSGRVYSHMNVESVPYAGNKDCTFTINTQPGRRINIRFDYFDLAPGFDRAHNQCRSDADRFMVYESGNIYVIKNGILQPEMTYCGGTGIFPKDYQSYSNVVTIRFLTDGISSADAGVKLVYTSYKPPQEGSDDCFRCVDNSMCIDEALTCNGVPNCNDDSDEAHALCMAEPSNFIEIGIERLGLGVVATIGGAIGLLILIIFITCIACCCCCRKGGDDDSKQYRTPPTPRPGSYPSHNSNYSSYSSSASTTNGMPGGMHPMPGLHSRMYEGLHGMNGSAADRSMNGSMNGMNGMGSLPHQHSHQHLPQQGYTHPHQHSMNGINRGSPYPNYPPMYPSLQNGGYSVAYNHDNGRMEFPHKV
ncbi:uncharacterized protein [Asterias amurensis]|uniref:uncharacterized protein n=1 Tax=Asterias amurensis TaxID=7602 RepID=UPI003AB39FE5